MIEVRVRQRVASQSRWEQSLDLVLEHIPDQLRENLTKSQNPGTSSGKLEKKTPSTRKFLRARVENLHEPCVNLTSCALCAMHASHAQSDDRFASRESSRVIGDRLGAISIPTSGPSRRRLPAPPYCDVA